MRAATIRLRPAVLRAATWAGVGVGALIRSVPGVAGVVLVSYGFYEAWHPLGFIVAGAFVIAERWMP
jgi:hypothetical protein